MGFRFVSELTVINVIKVIMFHYFISNSIIDNAVNHTLNIIELFPGKISCSL